MDVNTMKTVAVFAVIFGCFAVLYPKIFHPILMSGFGLYPEKNVENDFGKQMPPHLRKPGMQGSSRPVPGFHDDTIRHMKHASPHPGMRAAAEMQKQAGTTGSGRGAGMMGVVLPMYAIGIVVYLIYTLSKVFGGKKRKEDEQYVKRHFDNAMSNVRYDADRRKFMYGQEDSDQEDEDMYSYRQNKRKQRDLERLLFKADKDKISDLEMRELRKRLLETEAQMTRILQAMNTVSDKVTQHVDEYQDEENKENISEDGLSDIGHQHGQGDVQYESAYQTRSRDNAAEYDESYDQNIENEEYDENYDDDFEDSESEIEENIEIEEGSDEENAYVTGSREQGDGEESHNVDAFPEDESQSSEGGKYDREFPDNESQENEDDIANFDEEFVANDSPENESESDELIGDHEQDVDKIMSDLRKRTVKGTDPRNSED